MSSPHKFKIMNLKCEVDIGIAPVIQWLASFRGVVTHYCCQGGDKEHEDAYVSFSCSNSNSILVILNVFHKYNWPKKLTMRYAKEIKCNISAEGKKVLYRVSFGGYNDLVLFVKYMKTLRKGHRR